MSGKLAAERCLKLWQALDLVQMAGRIEPGPRRAWRRKNARLSQPGDATPTPLNPCAGARLPGPTYGMDF
ncbi:MAG: hypothetical protein BGO16_01165 [Nitrobacter sp. 62-23]|nr:MAG: hypothetical protein BGO16_01165 [Nitrobacter sp. 62-23]